MAVKTRTTLKAKRGDRLILMRDDRSSGTVDVWVEIHERECRCFLCHSAVATETGQFKNVEMVISDCLRINL